MFKEKFTYHVHWLAFLCGWHLHFAGRWYSQVLVQCNAIANNYDHNFGNRNFQFRVFYCNDESMMSDEMMIWRDWINGLILIWNEWFLLIFINFFFHSRFPRWERVQQILISTIPIFEFRYQNRDSWDCSLTVTSWRSHILWELLNTPLWKSSSSTYQPLSVSVSAHPVKPGKTVENF